MAEALERSLKFQSTLSVRRATGAVVSQLFNAAKFQSTLSVRRATGCGCGCGVDGAHFNPRSP